MNTTTPDYFTTYPSADVVESAGLDVTLRDNGGEPWTWEQVHAALRAADQS